MYIHMYMYDKYIFKHLYTRTITSKHSSAFCDYYYNFVVQRENGRHFGHLTFCCIFWVNILINTLTERVQGHCFNCTLKYY